MQKAGVCLKKLGLSIILVVFLSFISPDLFAIDFTSHGYYRNRYNFTYNLDTQNKSSWASAGLPINNDRFGVISWNQMRLRLEPLLKLNDFIFIEATFDILDNVVFGSQATRELAINSPIVGTVSLPAGAGSISMVGGAAGENGSINVRRVWAEVLTPIGQLRFGRQPSNWGLGIFQNDGNGIQDDFGDTADRLLFITQKEFNDGSSLSVGALWDIAYEAQADPRIEGLGGAIRDNGQDANQWAGIILYDRPEATLGLFGGVRKRDGGRNTTTTAYYFDSTTATGLSESPRAAGIDGDTLIYFLDAYGKYTYNEYNFKLEFVYLGGDMSTGIAIDAIPMAATMPDVQNVLGQNIPGVIQLPPEQDVRIFMTAFEAYAKYRWGGEWKLKAGFAQGDATPLSNRITQYGFRPDYQIAFLMFHYPLGTSPALIPTGGPAANTKVAGGLPITGNYINNAIYIAGTYKHHFDFSDYCKQCNDFSVGLRLVTAWADKTPVDIDFAALFNSPTMPVVRSRGKWYGIECDVLAEARLFDYMTAEFEGGVLIPGGAYDINVNLIDPSGMLAPILPQKASVSYGGRLSLILQF